MTPQPGVVLWVHPRSERVEPAVVEGAIGIREVGVRLGEVVPIQLAMVFQHSAV